MSITESIRKMTPNEAMCYDMGFENGIKVAIETTSCITLDRLAELVAAERDGRIVVLPVGKIGDYVEWNTGASMRLFQIQSILIEPDGERYDLGDLAPFVNHEGINRILTRAEAEAAMKGATHDA